MTAATTMLLDANVLSYFFNVRRKNDLAVVAKAMPLAVVEEVHIEALAHKTRGDEYRKWQASSDLKVRALAVGGAGSACLGVLRGNANGMKDLGEHASIALAIEDPSISFVTNDKNALWIAAREILGSDRVLRFWTFLHRAQSAAGLGAAAVGALAANGSLKTDAPLWLPAWVAGLPP